MAYASPETCEDRYSLDGKQETLIICDSSREGSIHDIKRVIQFCKQNHFLYSERNQYPKDTFSKAGLMKDLQDFRGSLDQSVCCLAVFIMAHGGLGHINVNGDRVELQDIFEMFDNRRCPALRGKPKLILIQACRGVKGNEEYPYTDTTGVSAPSNSLWPVESDFLFVYAVCPGNLAICYRDSGSLLFEEMNKVLECKDAMSMFDLFTMVNHRLMQRTEKAGFKTDKEPISIINNFIMSRLRLGSQTSVGGSLHIVDRLTKTWYLPARS